MPTPNVVPTSPAPTVEYSFELLEEDMPVRGNAMASGDEELDREVEDDILRQLDRGNLAAWCLVKVTATLRVEGHTYEGHAYLGGCSHESERAIEKELFEDDSHDLKGEALASLRTELEQEAKRGDAARAALATLP